MNVIKILIISHDLIPGRSGGWTSTCDLLERDHELTFLCGRMNGIKKIEGHFVSGFNYNENLLRQEIPKYMMDNDFALCLGDRESAICAELNVPFMTRYHTLPFNMELARKVKNDAFWTIENHNLPQLNDIRDDIIPHCVDIERYTECYNKHLKMDWSDNIKAVLLATLNHVESPMTFIKAIKASKIIGYVIGEGVIENEVALATYNSRGRCHYIGGRNRLELPSVLSNIHLGVSCLSRNSQNNRQLKIIEYCAAGIFPIISSYSESEGNFTRHTFTDTADLVRVIEFITKRSSEMQVYSAIDYNRFVVKKIFNARKWSVVFNEKLEERWNKYY